jgi:5-methylcytosine-specific restriction endonuclease McrA
MKAEGLMGRQSLSRQERERILAKTARRCHICGGKIDGPWHADHVFAHSAGGQHAVDNYLPAHSLCNNYRWDYTSKEFQEILKLGVWARTQIIRQTGIGRELGEKYLAYERRRISRRKGL